MNCPICNSSVPASAQFCPDCGFKLPAAPAVAAAEPAFTAAEPAPAAPIFTAPEPTPAAPVFGAPEPAPVAPVFGAPEPAPAAPVFTAPEPAPAAPVFGAPEPTPAAPVFGAPEPAPAAPVFGAPEPTPAAPVFTPEPAQADPVFTATPQPAPAFTPAAGFVPTGDTAPAQTFRANQNTPPRDPFGPDGSQSSPAAAPQPMFFDDNLAPIVSLGSWLGTLVILLLTPIALMLLFGLLESLVTLPTLVSGILGIVVAVSWLVLCFVFAFSKRFNPNKRNLFRAVLILYGIVLVIGIALGILFATVLSAVVVNSDVWQQIVQMLQQLGYYM